MTQSLHKVLTTSTHPSCDMATHTNLLRSQFVAAAKLGLNTVPTEGPIPTPPKLTQDALSQLRTIFPVLNLSPTDTVSLKEVLTNTAFNRYSALNFFQNPNEKAPEKAQIKSRFKGLFHDPAQVFVSTKSMFSVLRSLQVGNTPLKVHVKDPSQKESITHLEATQILTQVEDHADVTIIGLDQLDHIQETHQGRIIIVGQNPQDFASKKEMLDRYKESNNPSLRNIILFANFSQLNTVAPCALVMIPDSATRASYINVESHVRASLPIPTQLLAHQASEGEVTILANPDSISKMEAQVNTAYATYFAKTYGCQASAHNHTVDHGASGATLSTFLVEKSKGKTIFIASTPCFSPESGMAKSAGLEIGVGPLNPKKSWVEGMKELVLTNPKHTPAQVVLVITAPNNPDGHIPSATEVHDLLEWTKQNNVSVIADLTYSELIFSGNRPEGPSHKDNYTALVAEFYTANATLIFSHSKGRSLVGHRIASVISKDPEQIEQIKTMRNRVSGNPSIIGLIALNDSLTPQAESERNAEFDRFEAELKHNREILKQLITENNLQDIVQVPTIDGGLYICVAITDLSTTEITEKAKEKNLLILDQTNFGYDTQATGGFFRISLSGPSDKKAEAFKIFIESIKR
jgi:aspartate/methionine/tyrosine aminotransferase